MRRTLDWHVGALLEFVGAVKDARERAAGVFYPLEISQILVAKWPAGVSFRRATICNGRRVDWADLDA
jgi:hypothetical protein